MITSFSVEDPEELDEFCNILNSCLETENIGEEKVGLIMFVESARSLLQLEDICIASKKLESQSPLVIEALVFGSDDFVADIGATRTKVRLDLKYETIKVDIFIS